MIILSYWYSNFNWICSLYFSLILCASAHCLSQTIFKNIQGPLVGWFYVQKHLIVAFNPLEIRQDTFLTHQRRHNTFLTQNYLGSSSLTYVDDQGVSTSYVTPTYWTLQREEVRPGMLFKGTAHRSSNHSNDQIHLKLKFLRSFQSMMMPTKN